MKEEITVEMAKVRAWEELFACLERMTKNVRLARRVAQVALLQQYSNGGEGVLSSRHYADIQEANVMLAAYDIVRATILKCMG